MKQHTITSYFYSELPTDEAKANAREWFSSGNQYDDLPIFLRDSLNTLLEENNITADTKPEIYYSLSYCQGDGVQFLGTFTHREKSYTITSIGHYSHSYCTEISADDEEDTNSEELAQFTELYHTVCKQLEDAGYAEIEYQDSEEYIAESLEANEYQFTKDGRLFTH